MIQCEDGEIFIDYTEWMKLCLDDENIGKNRMKQFRDQNNGFYKEFQEMWPGEELYIIKSYNINRDSSDVETLNSRVSLKRKCISLKFAFASLSYLLSAHLSLHLRFSLNNNPLSGAMGNGLRPEVCPARGRK